MRILNLPIDMANALVLNAGSGSQKVALYAIDPDPEGPTAPVWQAAINSTTPGQPEDKFRAEIKSEGGQGQLPVPRDWSLSSKIQALIQASWEGDFAVLEGSHQIDFVGHRVVHGGLEFSSATVVTPQVEATIDRLGELAPLHNPANLEGIRACREVLGESVPQFAVFDTAFHRTLPEAATVYAGPYEWVEQGLVRYGFHGISYRYASRKALEIIKRQGDENVRQILCHLGGGCSLAAVKGNSMRRYDHGIYSHGRRRHVHTLWSDRSWNHAPPPPTRDGSRFA